MPATTQTMAGLTYAELAKLWLDAEDENDDLTCMAVDDELQRRGDELNQHSTRRLFWEACCAYMKK